MKQVVALYGFTRRKDGFRVRPSGVDHLPCYAFHTDMFSAYVRGDQDWVLSRETFSANELPLADAIKRPIMFAAQMRPLEHPLTEIDLKAVAE